MYVIFTEVGIYVSFFFLMSGFSLADWPGAVQYSIRLQTIRRKRPNVTVAQFVFPFLARAIFRETSTKMDVKTLQ